MEGGGGGRGDKLTTVILLLVHGELQRGKGSKLRIFFTYFGLTEEGRGGCFIGEIG